MIHVGHTYADPVPHGWVVVNGRTRIFIDTDQHTEPAAIHALVDRLLRVLDDRPQAEGE